jgi:hypothetical protein
MLVCNVSMRPPRRAIAADLAEATIAADATATGQVVFVTLVDDPANVHDIVDGYLGPIMLEAASASDAADATVTAAGVINNTWNPADKTASMTLSNGNLTAVGTANQGVRAQLPAATKFYFEITSAVAIWNGGLGIARSTANLGTVTVNAANAALVTPASSGNILFNSSTPIGGAAIGAFAINDVLCVAVDLVNQRIWFRKNAGNWNNNASADPVTNVGGINISTVFTTGTAYPLAATAVGTSSQAIANFGATSFAFTQPSGFSNAAVA